MTNNDKKELVKQRYSELALNSDASKDQSCCCGTNPTQPSKKTFTIMSEDYSNLKGYEKDAVLKQISGEKIIKLNIDEGATKTYSDIPRRPLYQAPQHPFHL